MSGFFLSWGTSVDFFCFVLKGSFFLYKYLFLHKSILCSKLAFLKYRVVAMSCALWGGHIITVLLGGVYLVSFFTGSLNLVSKMQIWNLSEWQLTLRGWRKFINTPAMDNQQVFILHLWSARSEKAFEKCQLWYRNTYWLWNLLYLVSICTEKTLEFFWSVWDFLKLLLLGLLLPQGKLELWFVQGATRPWNGWDFFHSILTCGVYYAVIGNEPKHPSFCAFHPSLPGNSLSVGFSIPLQVQLAGQEVRGHKR